MKITSEATGLIELSAIEKRDQDQVGNKTARLGELFQAGFSVPAGFCISADVYNRYVLSAAGIDFQELIDRRAFGAIREWILQLELDPALVESILAKYRGLLAIVPSGTAVRSSSTAEDLQRHSFAGLYESVLGIYDEVALLDAIRTCWASYWSDEAVDYRERAGLDHRSYGMAVLVQAMVQPFLSGVFFTKISPEDPDTALIEFVQGTGAGLMNGDVRGDRLLVDRRSGHLRRPSPIEAEMDVSRLVSLGLAVERHQGGPQDIEWVMDSAGKLWILQTRPITIFPGGSIAPVAGVEDGWLITYDEPFSTLGCEIAIQRYQHWIRAINASFKTNFEPQMRNLDGLLYYQPYWRRTSRPLQLWMRFWQTMHWINAEHIQRQYTRSILPAYIQRIHALEQGDVAALKWVELLARFNEAIYLYLQFQFTSYAIGAASTLSASFLNRACQLFFKGENRWNALDFLAGINDASVRRELAMDRLGQMLKGLFSKDELIDLDYARLLSVQEKGERGNKFWKELQAFLGEYGYVWADRYPRDPAWQLNPEAVIASLKHAALTASGASLALRHQRQQKKRSEAIRRATMRLRARSRFPWRVMVFRWLLQRAEKIFPYKEDRNHYTYKAVMVIRLHALEIGRRLAARGLLSSDEDVFFLSMEEIQQMWTLTRPVSAQLRTIDDRKRTYIRSRQRVQQRRPVRQWDMAEEASGDTAVIEVKGEACSPGLAQGPARLVSGLGELQRVQPGEIVVCTQLRPAWSSVFARAGGVVIEMGSLLSHGSTLAREYGIPVVINVAGISQAIREDDWIVVDGNLGKIAIERSAVQKS